MYRLDELGDCFLLTFTTTKNSSHLLVDCGSFRNGGESVQRLRAITDKITEVLAGQPLDVVVGTHQHNDHVSGFVHCEEAFRKMRVGQVWLSWLDHPTDKQAQSIGKAHNNLKLKLAQARDALHAAVTNPSSAREGAVRSLDVLNDMLGFYGAKEAGTSPSSRQGVEILKSLGKAEPEYLEPAARWTCRVPAGSVRIHVLGLPGPTTCSIARTRARARATTIPWRRRACRPSSSSMRRSARRNHRAEEQHYPSTRNTSIRGRCRRAAGGGGEALPAA